MTASDLRRVRRKLSLAYGPLSLRRFGELLGISGPEPGRVVRDMIRGHADISPAVAERARHLLRGV